MWQGLSRPGMRAFPRVLSVALLLFGAAGCNLNTPVDGGVQAFSGTPSVRIIAPLPNATYRENINVPIQAQVSNAGPDIGRVEVSVDNTVIQTFDDPNSGGAPTFGITHTWAASGAGTHTIDVVAFRADGSSSPSAAVTITVVAQGALEQASPTPTRTSGDQSGGSGGANPTPRPPTNTPAPTEIPASATPSTPQITTRQGINVRSGPGTNFNPPIGSLAAGQTAPLLGRNPAGDWYKIRYYNAEAWVFAGLVDVSGDTSSLPIDPGPPTPLPPTPVPVVPVAPTSPPAATSNANLVAGNWRFDPPGDPVCNQTFNIFLDVANLGTEATISGGTIDVRDVRAADNSLQGSTVGAFPIIQPGQTIAVGPIPLTISTFYNEQHRIILTINPNGAVPENNRNDNVREITYTLQKGGCP